MFNCVLYVHNLYTPLSFKLTIYLGEDNDCIPASWKDKRNLSKASADVDLYIGYCYVARRICRGTYDKKKLKCRRIKKIGTNIAKKVCDTKENWEALENRNRVGVDEYTRRTQEGANIINESSSVDQAGGMSTGVLGGP